MTHVDTDPTPPHGTERKRPPTALLIVAAVIAAVIGYSLAGNTEPDPAPSTPSNSDVLELVWDGMPPSERAEVCASLDLLGNDLAYAAMISEMDTMRLTRGEFDYFFAVHC